MNKSDLRAIILEELEKSNGNLLTEKFASPIIADISKKLNTTDLWNSTANTYGIAWDQVKDEHVDDNANPGKNYINIFLVKAGTKNPYADSYYSGEFYSGGLLGISVGKKVIGFAGNYIYNDKNATKKNKRIDFNASRNIDKAGIGAEVKVWNYKRMVEVSTEVFSIDLDAVKGWNSDLQSFRADQKKGAIAMDKNSDVLRANKQRYKVALKEIQDAGVEGKGLQIVTSHLEDAESILQKELTQKIKDTRSGVVYPGWDDPFTLAVNLHKDMVNKFEDFARYSKLIDKDVKLTGKVSWYSENLTDISHDVKSLKADFDKRMKNATAQKQVKIDESVLPLNEAKSDFDAEYDKYHSAMGNLYKIVQAQDKGLARKFTSAWQSIEDVFNNYIGD